MYLVCTRIDDVYTIIVYMYNIQVFILLFFIIDECECQQENVNVMMVGSQHRQILPYILCCYCMLLYLPARGLEAIASRLVV